MTLTAVAYTSTAVAGLSAIDLDRLLVDARAHNKLVGVTGVLLYDGFRFFQYFEGPTEGVERIYGRIRSSRMHAEIKELYHAPVERTWFGQWHMACRQTGGSVLQELSNAQWKREAAYLSDDVRQAGDSAGMRALLEFWERQAQDA